MDVERLDGSDVLRIPAPTYRDDRGHLSVVWDSSECRRLGIPASFVLTKYSCSRRGVVRGLHFQRPPLAQGKLVCVPQGRVFLAAVDIRKGSPHFGRPATCTLSGQKPELLWIPEGFVLGSMALTNATIFYHLTKPHSPHLEAGIHWDDPLAAIPWPRVKAVMLSARDSALPPLSALPIEFTYAEQQQ